MKALLLACALAGTAAFGGENLIANGDFEKPGAPARYLHIGPDGERVYSAEVNRVEEAGVDGSVCLKYTTPAEVGKDASWTNTGALFSTGRAMKRARVTFDARCDANEKMEVTVARVWGGSNYLVLKLSDEWNNFEVDLESEHGLREILVGVVAPQRMAGKSFYLDNVAVTELPEVDAKRE